MDSNEAIEYLKRMHGETASQTAEPAKSESAQPVGEGGENKDTPEPRNEGSEGSEPKQNEGSERVADNVTEGKRKPSRQEKIDYAFQRERKRHKASMEAKDKRIAELEAKIKRYESLEQKDFDPNNVKDYITHELTLRDEKAELEQLKGERDRSDAEFRTKEAGERHERQVAECYPEEKDRDAYYRLLQNGGKKFQDFLAEYDDGTIQAFISDSTIAPKVISALMRNPETLRKIVERKNPMGKTVLLQQLENRLALQTRLSSRKSETKKALPVTGGAVKNPGVSETSGRRDWNQYLREHPRGY